MSEVSTADQQRRVRFIDPDAKVTRISGTFEFDDGSTHQFSIEVDGGWQQWGATQFQVGRSVDLIESLAQAAMIEGHLQVRDEVADEEDDS